MGAVADRCAQSMAVAVPSARRSCLLLPLLLLGDLELALVVATVVQALEVVVRPRFAGGRVVAVVLDALCCVFSGGGRVGGGEWGGRQRHRSTGVQTPWRWVRA